MKGFTVEISGNRSQDKESKDIPFVWLHGS